MSAVTNDGSYRAPAFTKMIKSLIISSINVFTSFMLPGGELRERRATTCSPHESVKQSEKYLSTRYLIIRRFAVGVRGRNIFTRSQQSSIFKAAYQQVPVNCTCLRNLGNFKVLFHTTTKKIPNITKPRAFLIERRDGEVHVSFKQYMHSPEWTGMYRDGRFSASAPSHRVFIGPVPRMRDAPHYMLKVVEEKTITSIEQRYEASHARLEATYPCGE